MIKRSTNFVEVAYFLSRFGLNDPPILLQTDSWKEVYHMFYESLNEGRKILAFEHSMKNSRDAFDCHFTDTQREGWKDKNGNPNKLTGVSLDVFNRLNKLSENEIWGLISKFTNLETRNYQNVFENLSAIEYSERDENTVKTEGGEKVYISTRIERNPSLRNSALKIHGCSCMVCGFNFEMVYGQWGKDWAEVHHLKPISDNKKIKRQTDPTYDLVILCANCHRMVHRKKGIVLTVEELKKKMK